MRTVSLGKVRRAIDDAESEFNGCWDILCSWKNRDKSQMSAESFMRFQPRLAEALLRLESLCDEIVRSRKHLIQTKRARNRVRVNQLLRALDKYTHALRETMMIGRGIGDAFAWFFYSKSYDMLERHLKRPAVTNFPTGIGGRGEVEFIRNARTKNHFVLYHGITTFLRVGDVSFVDIHTWQVTALGELKSKALGPGRVSISMSALAESPEKIPDLFAVPDKISASSEADQKVQPANLTRRLKKQMTAMAETIRRVQPASTMDVFNACHADELSRLASSMGRARVAHQQLGQGCAIVALRPFRGRTLSSRLFSRMSGPQIVNLARRQFSQLALNVCDKTSRENSLYIATLGTAFGWGALPFFWWPLDTDFLKKLYFGEVIITSIYNPLHFVLDLRNKGFTVIPIGKGRERTFKVSKSFDGGKAEVENFHFFLSLVQCHLFREASVAEMLASALERARGLEKSTRVQMQIVPRLF